MDVKAIWKEITSELIKKISSAGYDIWISKLEAVCISNTSLILVAPMQKTKDIIVKTYLETIKRVSAAKFDFISDVTVIDTNELELYGDEFKTIADVLEDNSSPSKESMTFNKAYTFDSFVVGESNRIVHAAAKAVASNPGDMQNPLFIHGGVGLGKTHIIQAIGNHIKERNPRANILYITTEQFVNDFIDSIQNKNNDENFNEANRRFREKYRKVDVLMIDDIQFISNKKSSQEALFHTFNDLYQNKKQIIFTSDRHPREIKELEDRLLSRFQSGLTVDISEPDLETRVQILKKKAMQRKFVADNSVLSFIAEKIDSNIRELEGALSKVHFFCSMNNISAPTIEVVRNALKDDIEENLAITLESIGSATSSYFNISREELLGKKKNKQFVEPRQYCIYLINEILSLPLVSIGEYFGGRDHTTIMYARDKISEKLLHDGVAQKIVSDLKNLILKK